MANPVKMRIYKKVGTGTGADNYVLYYPETTAEQVLYSYTGLTNVAHVKAALDKIFSEIDAIEGVLEFIGNSTVANLPTDDNKKGEVYVVQYPTGETDAHIWWSADGTKWEEYPSNTLFVCSADTDKNYINISASTSQAKAGWIPLGGTNSAYATKNEAIKTLSVSGSGITGAYASGTTFSLGGSMAVTPVSTMGITQTISETSTTNQIPSAKAVYDFAGAAGTLNIAWASTGYIAGTASVPTSEAAPLAAVGSGINWWYDENNNTYGINAKSIAVNNTITFEGKNATNTGVVYFNYDGSDWQKLSFGTGFRLGGGTDQEGHPLYTVRLNTGNGFTLNSTDNTIQINKGDGLTFATSNNALAVLAADKSISVTTSGVSVKIAANSGLTTTTSGIGLNSSIAGNGLAYSNGVVSVNVGNGLSIVNDTVGHPAVISPGVYSAVSVDSYGHASAGGQSVIFASNMDDPDLGALVVGGLAFIGSSSVTSTSGASGTSITIDSN